MELATLNAEPDGDEVRVEEFLGTKHLVAPVVLVREGVLNGGFLSYDEIQESALAWDDRPVTAPPDMDGSGHPTDDEGDFVSARLAENLERQGVGFLQNVEARDDLATNDDENPKGLRGEVWVNLERAKAVGEAAIEAARRLAEGETLEVSTGYYHKLHEGRGRFNGEPYDHEQFDLIPDHLALLPNERGACSWADGCGAPRVNEVLDDLGVEGNARQYAMAANQEEGDRVRWESDGQPRYGIIVDDQEGEDVDEVLVAVYAWDGDEWVRGDDTVNLALDTFEVIEQFPPEPAENADLSDRVQHAVHVLTGQSADCACGGHTPGADHGTDHDTDMNDTDYEALAERTGVSVETLKDMGDDEVKSLVETLPDPDDGGDGASNDGGAQNDNDNDGGDGDDDLAAEVESLREQVETLTESLNRDPVADDAREYLAENTERDREALDEWPDEAVVETAQAHGFGGYAAPRGDRVNRLGQAGGPTREPTGNGQPDEDIVGSTGALNQLDEGETASGGD